ncbi:uncharacterized protein F5891DRAFT_275112 [Suillus fuscotomentosus]|uniref:Uncharacterized protein n=1 Tax=Suillus fuscotomentosus TaxID=1912939 RepID=A0AAD4E9L3_9AGAM|nr:uncharacterized protein F5891DRAFT_275112 [Suillus fuscotomentosus]KAG1900964.1 hypothetical protein F5891DRAFT_275112 [Suillus fuscotomentosus]
MTFLIYIEKAQSANLRLPFSIKTYQQGSEKLEMIPNYNREFIGKQVTGLDVRGGQACFEGRESSPNSSAIDALRSCCNSSTCHLYHIAMAMGTASRRNYSIPNTHHNQPRLLPLPPYLKLRFCPIELRVRRPRAVSKLAHGLRVVYLRVSHQHTTTLRQGICPQTC